MQLEVQRCPCCIQWWVFKIHSNYFKFHYSDQIQIWVLRCTNCNKYHSAIPYFSLPGTSLGTQEVEKYCREREEKISRRKAGEPLLEKEFSLKHLKHIEKMIEKSVNNMKVLFSDQKLNKLSGYQWMDAFLKSITPETTHKINFKIYRINTYCLAHGVNAAFCSRKNILLFSKKKPGVYFSNNMGSYKRPIAILDSS